MFKRYSACIEDLRFSSDLPGEADNFTEGNITRTEPFDFALSRENNLTLRYRFPCINEDEITLPDIRLGYIRINNDGVACIVLVRRQQRKRAGLSKFPMNISFF